MTLVNLRKWPCSSGGAASSIPTAPIGGSPYLSKQHAAGRNLSRTRYERGGLVAKREPTVNVSTDSAQIVQEPHDQPIGASGCARVAVILSNEKSNENSRKLLASTTCTADNSKPPSAYPRRAADTQHQAWRSQCGQLLPQASLSPKLLKTKAAATETRTVDPPAEPHSAADADGATEHGERYNQQSKLKSRPPSSALLMAPLKTTVDIPVCFSCPVDATLEHLLSSTSTSTHLHGDAGPAAVVNTCLDQSTTIAVAGSTSNPSRKGGIRSSIGGDVATDSHEGHVKKEEKSCQALRAWHELSRASLLPLLSPLHAQRATGSDKHTRRVTKTRRRKSDGAVALKSRHTVVRTAGPICSDTARSGAPLQSVKAASRPRSQQVVTNSRLHRSSGVTNLDGEDGRLKAHERVIGWKKRQSEDLKARGQDEAANGRRSKEEVNLEAARKMAAARVEETTQRMLQDQEDRATKARAAELAEKAAKEAREKEQKRAEVYAINAVMRAAFEREFKAYSVEKLQETQNLTTLRSSSSPKPLEETGG